MHDDVPPPENVPVPHSPHAERPVSWANPPLGQSRHCRPVGEYFPVAQATQPLLIEYVPALQGEQAVAWISENSPASQLAHPVALSCEAKVPARQAVHPPAP